MVDEKTILKRLPEAFREAALPLPGRVSGKVREAWPLSGGRRLLVTSDRLSAFDRVLAAVPWKGQVLNQLSAWWFERTRDLIGNHLISLPDPNASVVLDATPLPVEVIVRGHITGVTETALWRRYELGERRIYGYDFPEGLRKNQRLDAPLITPTTKGGPGVHDQRLDCDEVVTKGLVPEADWNIVKRAALALFQRGAELAEKAGLILVDTKYEFGRAPDGSVILIDEVHTPDSSRFWKLDSFAERFAAGREPELFDKEFVRLAYAERGFRGDGEPPELDEATWVRTSVLYQTMYERLTGSAFDAADYPVAPRLEANMRKAGIVR